MKTHIIVTILIQKILKKLTLSGQKGLKIITLAINSEKKL